MKQDLKRIVILGGGSAGRLTANIITAEHCTTSIQRAQVTLIESPDIPTVGVGEGTWPQCVKHYVKLASQRKFSFVNVTHHLSKAHSFADG